jgi:hypothetical protein
LFLPATTARCHGGGCSGWEADEKAGSAAWRAEQLHGSDEGVDAVGEADQAGPVRDGASDAVVSHSQGEKLPALSYRDVHNRGVRVLRRIARASPRM